MFKFHKQKYNDRQQHHKFNQDPLPDYLDHSKLLRLIEKAERERNRNLLLFVSNDGSNIFHYIRSIDEFERTVRIINDKKIVKKLLISKNSLLVTPMRRALFNDELFIRYCKFLKDDLNTLKSAILDSQNNISLMLIAIRSFNVHIYDYLFKVFENDKEFIKKNMLTQDDFGKSIIYYLIVNKYLESLHYLFDYFEKLDTKSIFEIFSMKDSKNENQLHYIFSMGFNDYELIMRALWLIAPKDINLLLQLLCEVNSYGTTPLRNVPKEHLRTLINIILSEIKFEEKSLHFYHKLLLEHIELEDNYFKGVSIFLRKLNMIDESLYKELLNYNKTDTLLTRALRAEKPNIHLIKFLISEGSDLFAIDQYGNTAYEYIELRKNQLNNIYRLIFE